MPFNLFDSPRHYSPTEILSQRLDQWGYPSGNSYWWRRYPDRAVEEHK